MVANVEAEVRSIVRRKPGVARGRDESCMVTKTLGWIAKSDFSSSSSVVRHFMFC